MAKNISLMGASYSDVPAVTLPQTGGGTARFDDASVTTATAEDVAQGKVFLAANGTITTGTATGGGAVDSVNGQTGDVVLTASDVGALPDTTTIPTKTSDLTNDSGFVDASAAASVAPVQSVNGQTGTVSLSIPSSAADVGAIPAPSSASAGDFLVYNGSAWVAQSISTWQGGSY